MAGAKFNHNKIFCISVMRSWGGGEEFLIRLCKNITDYKFVIASPEGKVLKRYKENELRTLTINSLRKIFKKQGWNLKSFLAILFNVTISTFKLLRNFKSEAPSLVLANGLFAALYVLPSVIISGRKLMVVQHLIFNENSIETKVLKFVYRYSEKIVCVSEAVKENLLYLLKMEDSNKIAVIENGIDLPDYKSDIKNTGIISIGVVGSIIRLKGFHLIIEALKDILKSRTNVLLYIFGTTADNEDSLKYKEELNQLILDYGLNSKVQFKGYIESREEIYSSVNIVISYSLIPESFSFTVLEAMAYKKIVIAAEAGGPKELITDGETGFLVEPQNAVLLGEKILYCIENINSGEFRNIREKAFKRVKEKYSMEKFISDYKNLFDLLVK